MTVQNEQGVKGGSGKGLLQNKDKTIQIVQSEIEV